MGSRKCALRQPWLLATLAAPDSPAQVLDVELGVCKGPFSAVIPLDHESLADVVWSLGRLL